MTPPHRKFKKTAPDWYEEMYERQRKAHSSRRIRVEHGIAHLKNWRALARHLGRREHMKQQGHVHTGRLDEGTGFGPVRADACQATQHWPRLFRRGDRACVQAGVPSANTNAGGRRTHPAAMIRVVIR
ncbi:hypothetical protein [Streptomyces sp. NPDC050121]|uniref:hypothetical protein n=1 Tax=Streptomyces sp. NPDC050121 TaxID=3365601 RepID=UPI00379BFC7C